MNCWFCQKQFYSHENMCLSQTCGASYHFRNGNLYRVYFHAYFPKNKEYIISYYPEEKNLRVVERIDPPFTGDYTTFSSYHQNVLRIPYTSLTLTPQNVKEKLPILLLFL